MKSDSYTPTIPLDELVALARTYARAGPSPTGDSTVSADDAHRMVEEVICPCIRGEACVCDALADEFLRLARQFHDKRNKMNPRGQRSWTDRWENEGGSTVEWESGDQR
jgi:hypothetical protein